MKGNARCYGHEHSNAGSVPGLTRAPGCRLRATPPYNWKQMPRKKIAIVGAGRVGTGLALSLARSGRAIVAVASRSVASARALARRVPGARAVSSPQDAADRADLVFLTVPDDSIATVASAIRWRAGAACVHCSGAGDL